MSRFRKIVVPNRSVQFGRRRMLVLIGEPSANPFLNRTTSRTPELSARWPKTLPHNERQAGRYYLQIDCYRSAADRYERPLGCRTHTVATRLPSLELILRGANRERYIGHSRRAAGSRAGAGGVVPRFGRRGAAQSR